MYKLGSKQKSLLFDIKRGNIKKHLTVEKFKFV